MAITKENLRELYQQYEKTVSAELKANWQARTAAEKEAPEVFLTQGKAQSFENKKPRPVTLSIRRLGMSVQDLVAAYASIGIELEERDTPSDRKKSSISPTSITLSPQDLKKIADHIKRRQRRFGVDTKDATRTLKGIPYSQLIRSSAKGDKERAKLVRSCTPYGHKGNTWFFQVSGNEKPHYRVQIRMENYDQLVRSNLPPLAAAQQAINGRLSIDCPCGRHQFWYRYLATIGEYAIIPPAEHSFPKIRNPQLKGCCCKHVLKTLQTMRSNRFQLMVSQEIVKDRNKVGYGGSSRVQVFSDSLLQQARQSRLSGKFAKQFQTFQGELKNRLKPRGRVRVEKATPELTEAQLDGIRMMLKNISTLNLDKNVVFTQIEKGLNITRQQLESVIKEKHLE